MFKVSTKMRYGLRFLIDLAQNNNTDELVSTREIAERQDLSNNYLRQLVMLLSKEGIIGSARGKNGGVFLKKDPADINMYDLYVLFEGVMVVVDCVAEDFECKSVFSDCMARNLWNGMNKRIVDYLKNVTLKQVLEENFE